MDKEVSSESLVVGEGESDIAKESPMHNVFRSGRIAAATATCSCSGEDVNKASK